MSNQNRRRGPMGGHHGPGAPAEKAKDFKGTMKKLLGELSAFKISLIGVIIFVSYMLYLINEDKKNETKD